jgi:hypothetical protein
MSNPSRLLLAALTAALSGLLLLPAAEAGTLLAERVPGAARSERSERSAAASTLYQLRCWQHGRLLFEEQDVRLDDEVVGGLKLRGSDRQRHPLLLTDTGNATCLLRSTPEARR